MVALQLNDSSSDESSRSSSSPISSLPKSNILLPSFHPLPFVDSMSSSPTPPYHPGFYYYYYYDYNLYHYYPCFLNQHPCSITYYYPPTPVTVTVTCPFPLAQAQAQEHPPITVYNGDDSHLYNNLLALQPPLPDMPVSVRVRRYEKNGNGKYRKRSYNPYNNNNTKMNEGVRKIEKKCKSNNKSEHATGYGSHLPQPQSPPSSSDQLAMAECTTVMLKNIPNTLGRTDLINLLDQYCREHNSKLAASSPFQYQYDFLYLPFDFQQKQNLGYAFVNFTSVEGALTLHTCWTGKGWNSWKGCSKIREITPAKLQGLEKCKKHFQVSVFHCHSEEYLPVEFSPPRDGLNVGVCSIITVGTLAYPDNAVIAAPPKHQPSRFKGKRIVPPRLCRRSSPRLCRRSLLTPSTSCQRN